MIELPMKSGEPFKITAIEIREMQVEYPGINVEAELRKMRQWLLANPGRREVQIRRFIHNWLSRAKPETTNAACVAPEPPPRPNYSAATEVAEKWLAEAKRGLPRVH